MIYWIYKDSLGKWRWYLMGANNRKIADSVASYFNKSDATADINLVRGSTSAPIYEKPFTLHS